MNWFRVYHDIIDDPKVLALPRAARWHIIELFAISSRQTDSKLAANSLQTLRGCLPPINQIAIHMRLSLKKTREVIQLMIDNGFIDASEDWSVLAIHGWENRQFKSDDVSSRSRESMQRSRERSPKQPVNVHLAGARSETETEQNKPPNKPPRGGESFSDFDLDPKIPVELWLDFEAMRKRIRKPMTHRARSLVVRELIKLEVDGHPVAAVLEQSIRNCWQDVFPIRQPNGSQQPAQAKAAEDRDAKIQAKFAAAMAKGVPGA